MILFQITVVHRACVARPNKVFFRTSKRVALREANQELSIGGDNFSPARVLVRKIILKDLPPKKLVIAILNAPVQPRLWDRIVESEDLIFEKEGKA